MSKTISPTSNAEIISEKAIKWMELIETNRMKKVKGCQKTHLYHLGIAVTWKDGALKVWLHVMN